MSQARPTLPRPVTHSTTAVESASSQNAVPSTSASTSTRRHQAPQRNTSIGNGLLQNFSVGAGQLNTPCNGVPPLQRNIKTGAKPDESPLARSIARPLPYQLRSNTVLLTARSPPANLKLAPTATSSSAVKSTHVKQTAPQAIKKRVQAAGTGVKVTLGTFKNTECVKPQGPNPSKSSSENNRGKRNDSVEIVFESLQTNKGPKAVPNPGMSPSLSWAPSTSSASAESPLVHNAVHQSCDAKMSQTVGKQNTSASLQIQVKEDGAGALLNHAPDDSDTKKPKKMGERFAIMLTFEKCSCEWCFENLDVGDGIVLQDCCHSFCRNCLVTAIDTAEYVEVRCPFQDQCHGLIFDSEIKALLTPERYQAHIKKSDQLLLAAMRDNPNMYNCKTPNCGGCCEFAEDSKVFLCHLCNKSNCLACKTIHEGVECAEYQRVFQEAVGEGKTIEEAHAYANTHATNGFEQLVGTVSQWMSASTLGDGKVGRRGLQYKQVLEKMANQDLWITNKEFECAICFEKVPVGEGVIFECMHSFCRDCAVANVEHATNPEIKCPYLDGNYSCVYLLKPREIRALVSPELYEVHLARSVKLAENAMANTFHCKTPDCAGWCEYEPGTEMFQCWICQKRNCLLCEVIHEQLSCQDYKNRIVQNANDVKSNEAVEAMIASGECMRCPHCKVPVQKIAGCDWVPCSVCKTEICWITRGPRWGPGGKGDTSGGCRCRVNGMLCHPKCGNCH